MGIYRVKENTNFRIVTEICGKKVKAQDFMTENISVGHHFDKCDINFVVREENHTHLLKCVDKANNGIKRELCDFKKLWEIQLLFLVVQYELW